MKTLALFLIALMLYGVIYYLDQIGDALWVIANSSSHSVYPTNLPPPAHGK